MRVLAVNPATLPDGSPRICDSYYCSPEYAGKAMIGRNWLLNLVKKPDGSFGDGKLRATGRWYGASLVLSEANTITLRGHNGPFHRDMTLSRVDAEFEKIASEQTEKKTEEKPAGYLLLGSVRKVEGNKIEVNSRTPSKVPTGQKVAFLNDVGKQQGTGQVTTILHTQFKVKLVNGAVKPGDIAVFYLR